MEKEARIRSITSMYYSRPEIQEAIFSFSQNREVVPRYFEGFGKRPDSLQYKSDIFEFAKKGATSFHCSEELWENPLEISTGMNEKQLNNLRVGWDLLIDIDCKYFDFSKKAAEAIIRVFKKHKLKNFGIKFSGGKGFHLIVPWIAFPKTIAGVDAKNLFPEIPRKIVAYVRAKAEEELQKLLSDEDLRNFKNSSIKVGRKCNKCKEIAAESKKTFYVCPKCKRKEVKKNSQGKFKCPDCFASLEISEEKSFYECRKCSLDSDKNPDMFSRNMEVDLFALMGLDLILVSPRHLFRMPYSLHEKTALASVPVLEKELENFDIRDADPMKVKIKNFMPDSKEGEATELLVHALDWYKENFREEPEKKEFDFKPVKIDKLSNEMFPPSIKKILEGLEDGKKRALFILINLFRSIGIEKDEIEKRIYEWNKKNKNPLKEGYIKSQIFWSFRNKIVPPPNFSKDYYRGIGIIPTDEEMRYKNPANYIIKKNKDNFKN